jgi:RNA polymerase sigma-70 factor (ECF subfamily)
VREESDALLVRRVLAGEIEAFAGLVDRYRDRLGRYAFRMLGNAADAEDALQDTFVRAYRSLARCTRPDRLGPWLFGILVNRCRTHAARRARRQATLLTDEMALADAAVNAAAEDAEWHDAIQRALAQLSPDRREAFLLRHVEDLSYEDMEHLTGVRAATLRMRVLRAREELRRLLTEAVHG